MSIFSNGNSLECVLEWDGLSVGSGFLSSVRDNSCFLLLSNDYWFTEALGFVQRPSFGEASVCSPTYCDS